MTGQHHKSNKTTETGICEMCPNQVPPKDDMFIRVRDLFLVERWGGPQTDDNTLRIENMRWCGACSRSFARWRAERVIEGGDKLLAMIATSLRWAREWDACQGCGATDRIERPHVAKGKCGMCYMREYRAQQKESDNG